MSTNLRDHLVFSQDTLVIDTLFSNVGSTTASLKVRNIGNQPILIQSIKLISRGLTGFRINLDGVTDSAFENVTIPAHDSLFLFVSVRTPIQHTPLPVSIVDAIVFENEASSKQIVLKTWSWDAEIIRGETFESDTTFRADKPYLIYDSLIVAANSTLTLLPGVQFFFHDKAFMRINGTLIANGTQHAPIQFRGDRLDKVIPQFPYDNYPAQWGYLHFTRSSNNNRLDYVDLHGSYYGILADTAENGLKIKVSNSKIHNVLYSCVWSVASNVEFLNCQLTNSGSYTVALIGGQSNFVHCTIANHQWLATRDGPALVVSNTRTKAEDNNQFDAYPLQARFLNCIITGSQLNEFGYDKKASIGWDLTFDHCLIQTEPFPFEYGLTIDCLFKKNPEFLSLGSYAEHYVYDFRIKETSPAKDVGNPSTLLLYPNDMNGVSRLIDHLPDMGAFEWEGGL